MHVRGKKINPVLVSVFRIIMKPKMVFLVAALKCTHGQVQRSFP